MKTINKRILIAFLIVMMTISGIAPSVMSNSLIVQANPEDDIVITPEPSVTPELSATPEPTEESGDGTDGGEGESTPEVEPTPEVEDDTTNSGEETPGVTPDVMLELTPEVTPSVTPELTPAVPPGLSIGLFNIITPGSAPIDGMTIAHTIDISGESKIYTIDNESITEWELVATVLTKTKEIAYTPGDKIEVTGTGQSIVRITEGDEHFLVLNNVNTTTVAGAAVLDGNNLYSSPIQIGNNTGWTTTNYNNSRPVEATIHLASGSNNSVVCNGNSGTSGILQSGIAVVQDSKLRITSMAVNPGSLTAKGGSYASGIGGGANCGWGNITIDSGIIDAHAKNLANDQGNGAGIGGGGSNSVAIRGKAGDIMIEGTANVTATSYFAGAGIGSGGTTYASPIMSGGKVTIKDNAIVNATSRDNGAGIGGGGIRRRSNSNNTPATPAGAGGTITILDNAQVTATSVGNGAGIGGGGSGGGGITGDAGIAGAGGSIIIDGTPIVVASGAQKDMGSGATTDGTIGTDGTITIINGNVYADKNKSSPVKNDKGDVLGRADIHYQREGIQSYTAIGTLGPYIYQAKRDAEMGIYIWVPLGNQVVVHRYRDVPAPIDNILVEILDFRTVSFPQPVPPLTPGGPDLGEDYEVFGDPQAAKGPVGDALPTIVYEYVRVDIPRDFYAFNAVDDTLTKYTVGERLGDTTVWLTREEAEITGSTTINKGGVYHLKTYDKIRGEIRITTSKKVVIIVDGAHWTNIQDFVYSHTSAISADAAPIRLDIGADVTLVVMDDSNNSFVNNSYNGNSSSQTAGIYVPGMIDKNSGVLGNKSTLTITGGVVSTTEVPVPTINDYKNTGILLAKSAYFAAGIGGGCNQNAGIINIWGGIITAHAGEANGAGIGGGGGRTAGGGKAHKINITGQANVTAISEEDGAAIGGAGGGYSADVGAVSRGPSDGGVITISGSDKVIVNATAKRHGAGIGGGGRSSVTVTGVTNVKGGAGGNITISGSVRVNATSEGMGAGIGGAGALAFSAGDGGTISITGDAVVRARSTAMGAAIGGGGVEFPGGKPVTLTEGRGGAGGTISITGNADVEAFSAGRGAGIGGGGANNGYGGSTSKLEFGGTVKINASSTISGAGIGGGGGTWGAGSADTIIIKENAYIVASAGEGITSGPLAVAGSPMGAGIGGGGSAQGTAGNAKSLTISGKCYVEAISGGSGNRGGGAAIGGGGSVDVTGTPGNGGDVEIKTDGTLTETPTVIANGNPIGMDFGYGIKPATGEKGQEGKLTITSGNVWAVNENTPLATNGLDVVKMRRAPHDDMDQTPQPDGTFLHYEATGVLKPTYDYTAYTHENTGPTGVLDETWAYIWKPSDKIDVTLTGPGDGKKYVPVPNSYADIDNRDPVVLTGKGKREKSSFINVDVLASLEPEEDEDLAEFDRAAEAIQVKWIRVSTWDEKTYGERNTALNVYSFDEKFAELEAAGGHNCGTIPAVAMGQTGLRPDGTFDGETRENGIFWVQITYGNKKDMPEGTYLEAGVGYYHFTIENYYTIIDVEARDVTVNLPGPERIHINDYLKLLKVLGIFDEPDADTSIYGIPFDLDDPNVSFANNNKIVKGDGGPGVGGTPTFGFDKVEYIPYSTTNLYGHKLRMPVVFDEVDNTLILNQAVIDNIDVDKDNDIWTGPNKTGTQKPASTSTINKKYYRMDYMEEYVLTVEKKVTGAFANTTKKFHFKAKFSRETSIGSGVFAPYDEEIGWEIRSRTGGLLWSGKVDDAGNPREHEFELSHGQYIDFFSFSTYDLTDPEHPVLAPPVMIDVTELDADTDNYVTTWTGKKVFYDEVDGHIEQVGEDTWDGIGGDAYVKDGVTGSVEITFTNHRLDIVPSAVEVSDSSFFGPMIAILELMVLAALLVRYRKVKQQRAMSKHFRKQ